MNRPDPDEDLLRRARLTLAVQNTVAMTMILLVVGAVALFVVTRGQRSSLEQSLRQTAATEEDVIDPPAGSWIFDLTASYRVAFLNGLAWNLVNLTVVCWLMLRARPRSSSGNSTPVAV